MKFCKHCNSPVANGLVYCPVCNNKIDEPKKKELPKNINNENIPWYSISIGQRNKIDNNKNYENKNKISYFKYLIIIFILILIFIFIFIFI